MRVEEITQIDDATWEVYVRLNPRGTHELYVDVLGEFEPGRSCNCHPHDPNCEHQNNEPQFTPTRYSLVRENGETIVCKSDLIIDMIVDGAIADAIQSPGDAVGADNGLKLWCDLKTDQERVEFMRSGRAWETGIFAKSVIPDLIDVYEFRISKSLDGRLVEGNFQPPNY